MNDHPQRDRLPVSRRHFLQASAGAAAATAISGATFADQAASRTVVATASQPAILGGAPVRSGHWPSWPVADQREADGLLRVLGSGDWYRYRAGEKGTVAQFERLWAAEIGTPHCQATNSGTSALICALAALDVGPGDEVIVPPYTFVATINAVLVHHALPVFVDSDFETAQIDASKIEERVNADTRALLPVHLGGAPCDMDQILEIAQRRDLKVIEDACQTHTASWRDRRIGSLGDAGCFSFQNSKNLTCGDGGAMTTNDPLVYARAQAFQNNGSGSAGAPTGRTSNGVNLRLTEFQGALLLAQHSRHDELARRREANGAYLSQLLDAIPGVQPKKTYPGTTRHGYHLYMFDFDSDPFAGMSRDRFMQALRAESIPVSGGYNALNRQPFIDQFLDSRGFKRIYSRERLKQYREQNQCPVNDRLVTRTCWFGQNVLLGSQADMDAIAEAIARIQRHAAAIVAA